MATLASSPPTSPSWPKRRSRAWALRCERYCCAIAGCFPLAFVYGLTTWAVWVEASLGLKGSENTWIGLPSSCLGIFLWIALNSSYTVAVFTDPGSPLTTRRGNDRHNYSALPVTEYPEFTSYTVSSTGGSRFCKKCQCPKPDRAHHCSTCKRCVLKMDHHCPWLATCVGLHNYKAFLLFLIYTSLFCWVCFAVAGTWTWQEVLNDSVYMDNFLPVNVVLLAILGGIIGLVLSGFTAWHISLAVRGVTTIECLEKTRYVSPLRKALARRHPDHQHSGATGDQNGDLESLTHRLQGYGNQILDAHANAIPGVTRAEEGEERLSPAPYGPGQGPGFHNTSTSNNLTPAQQALSRSYAEMERQREHDRYQDYLNEEDSEKTPHAFDHGWRRNLAHLFGDRILLWPLPICTTTGDGWRWEPSQRFLEERERLRLKREQDTYNEQQYHRELYQRNMNNSHAWIGGASGNTAGTGSSPAQPNWIPNRGRQETPERPPTSVSMQTLAPASPRPRPGDSDYEDEPEGESHGLLDPEAANRPPRARETDEWRDWE
ncbi:Zinc finger DHHC-type palmitoyltransferase [Penicillium malachiteum]|uniref:Zinc finger DHHC-type palmitoyltransferase n=1 Tax=Penicillium malachiteum TaxID=1324776 RepID=UPI0025491768|nr:Zinc finger DHHC-type palmitoyltransferase [Penicillium malachiteum]KAJ5736982.1 Zinc finger DHHC-type palmitoyltransferase [Penicillium malachiteum]